VNKLCHLFSYKPLLPSEAGASCDGDVLLFACRQCVLVGHWSDWRSTAAATAAVKQPQHC